jgi:hypothetical protein
VQQCHVCNRKAAPDERGWLSVLVRRTGDAHTPSSYTYCPWCVDVAIDNLATEEADEP